MDFQKAKTYYKQGMENLNLKQYEEAIKNFDKAIDINPEYTEAYTNRSIAKLGNKKQKPQNLEDYYIKSMEEYNEAIKINPKNTEAYNARCIAQLRLGTKEQNQQKIKDYYTKAIEDYDKAISIKPQNHDKGIENIIESVRAELAGKLAASKPENKN